MILTAERLRELMDYDADTGALTWKPRRKGVRPGTVGWLERGYRRICVDGRLYAAHRLVWLHVHGVWPRNQIDHINGVRDDNRLINLRDCTASENQHNSKKQKNNACGFKGVSWCSRDSKWAAAIRANGRGLNLGRFDTAEAAHSAYCEAAIRLHGKFARFE